MKEKYFIIGGELVAFLCMFFVDLYQAMFAVGFLIVHDTVTGIWVAWAKGYKIEGTLLKGWQHVKSRKMERVAKKLLLYPLVLIVAKVAQEYLAPAIPWIDITAGVLAMIEVRSIFENVGKLLGYSIWDRVKRAIDKELKVGKK